MTLKPATKLSFWVQFLSLRPWTKLQTCGTYRPRQTYTSVTVLKILQFLHSYAHSSQFFFACCNCQFFCIICCANNTKLLIRALEPFSTFEDFLNLKLLFTLLMSTRIFRHVSYFIRHDTTWHPFPPGWLDQSSLSICRDRIRWSGFCVGSGGNVQYWANICQFLVRTIKQRAL